MKKSKLSWIRGFTVVIIAVTFAACINKYPDFSKPIYIDFQMGYQVLNRQTRDWEWKIEEHLSLTFILMPDKTVWYKKASGSEIPMSELSGADFKTWDHFPKDILSGPDNMPTFDVIMLDPRLIKPGYSAEEHARQNPNFLTWFSLIYLGENGKCVMTGSDIQRYMSTPGMILRTKWYQ